MGSFLNAMPGLIFITLCYAVLCAASPFGTCRKCQGWGAVIRQTRNGRLKRGRDCRRCEGYGRRMRVGRRLYNATVRLHRDGLR
ncbi:hypothetical protein CK936_18290 [Streptomyces albireticuli]|uniref:Uncharacterized protein n=2 Tax=Streptomyces albireticuli TaxID=1940 RepID=A0A2A2D4X0_9ACTN|nr:hypothetical protein [Streptomyces albireticuli]PAU47538.1 hypothetical protein CK936_18290 [Streptomyces albireticuli]